MTDVLDPNGNPYPPEVQAAMARFGGPSNIQVAEQRLRAGGGNGLKDAAQAVDGAIGSALSPTSPAPVTAASDVSMGNPFGGGSVGKALNPSLGPGTVDFIGASDAGGGGSRVDADERNLANSEWLDTFGAKPAAKQAAAYYEPEGETYSRVGGKGIYDEAFTNAKGRREDALRDQTKLEGQKSDAVSEFYGQQAERDKTQAATVKFKAEQDAQQIAVRQRKLDEATQFYTNDLADQNKFWTNPGNIISAIAFSLMPIFSNDPAVGAKLINQAVNQDMANRQHAAQGTLGALQSNLAGYHKIAGDRQAGDLLAQAEMHRMAAQEIARVALKFESPISKAKAEAMIEDQNMRHAAAQMEFYKANVHTDPTRMDPALHNARAKGPDGWHQLGGAQAPAAGGPTGNAVQGSVNGSASTANMTGKLSPAAQAITKAGGAKGVLAANDRGVIPDDQVKAATVANMRAVGAMYKPNNPELGFQEEVAKAQKELVPFSVELAKNAAARHTISTLSQTMDRIARSEAGAGKDVEDFVSWTQKNMPTSWKNQYEAWTAKTPTSGMSPAEVNALSRRVAVSAFQHDFKAALNVHAHELYGGAQSDNELANMRAQISELSTWKQMKAFIDDKDRAQNAFVNANKVGLSPGAQLMYRIHSRGEKMDTPSNKAGTPERVLPGYDGGQSMPGASVGAPAPNMSIDPRSVR